MEMAGDFLIREVKKQELQRVAEIWLAANLDAHDFIPEAYWRDHLEMERELLAKAWICVCEEEGKILGFLGMNGIISKGFLWRRVSEAGESESCF